MTTRLRYVCKAILTTTVNQKNEKGIHMKKGSKYITLTQRRMIEAGLHMGMTKVALAEYVGVSISTIYRELKRGKCVQRKKVYDEWGDYKYKEYYIYSADLADSKFKMNMTSKGAPLKVGNDYDFVRYVEKRLNDKITPCALAGEMKRNKPTKTVVSKTTLYRYISMGIFMNITMTSEKKRKKREVRIKRPPRGTSIEKRPLEINQRNTFGNWEMDCVCSQQGKTSALLVLSERVTRKEIIFKMPNKEARTVVHCLNKLERRYGKLFRKVFKTITVDNGVEFSDFKGLEKSIYGGKRTSVYYCHPYSSYERGTNERINRDIRKKYPKGTDFTIISEGEIAALESWVNSYPRQIFNFGTSREEFDKQIAVLKQ